MSIDLIILAAGDLGREIHQTAQMINAIGKDTFRTVAFVDQAEKKIGKRIAGIPVISFATLEEFISPETQFICGAGMPIDRINLISELEASIENPVYAIVIHPSAVIFPEVQIESGVFVGANTTLATGSVVRHHAIVNQNCSIGHDSQLHEFSVISPGSVLSGRTEIRKRTFIGSSVVTYPGVRIGESCVISALTTVSRSIKDNKKVISKPNVIAKYKNELVWKALHSLYQVEIDKIG